MPDFLDVWSLGAFVGFMRANLARDFRVVYHPGRGELKVRGKMVSRREFEFDCLCRYCFEIRNVVFCVDEVWVFTEPGWMPTPLADLALTGRHRGVTLLYTAQRPQMVARGLTAVTSQFEVFRIQETADLDAMRGRLAPEALALVPSLPDRDYIARDEQNNWKHVLPASPARAS